MAERSAASWLHIAEVVADAARDRGFHRLGLLGTRWLVDSEVYSAVLKIRGFEFARPALQDRLEIHSTIMDELVCGVQRPEAIETLLTVICRLAGEGCDAVVLGCTELPLVLSDSNSPLPTLDSTRLLARASLRSAHG